MTKRTSASDAFGLGDESAGPGGLVLKDYLAILRRRLWVILSILVIVVTLGTVWVFKATPFYQGTAKILIERETPHATKFEEVVQLPASEQEYYKTQRELLQSRAVMEKALAEPGVADLPEIDPDAPARPSALSRLLATVSAMLGAPPPKAREPWERLRDQLAVQQLRGTHLLSVSAESTDPQRAALMANAVAQAFEKFHVERKVEITNEAFRFLQQQKEKQELQLLKAEDALQEFREKAQVVSLDVADPRNPVLYLHSQLNEELTKVRLQRIEVEAQLEAVRKALPQEGEVLRADNERLFSLPQVRKDPVVTQLRTQLLEAEGKAATLSTTYGPAHHQVQAATAAVALHRGELQRALAHVVGALRSELNTLRTQESELQTQYDDQNLRALDVAKKSLVFSRLENEAERQRKLFDVLVERMREVDVSTEYAKTNIEVVEAAEVAKRPYRPRKALAIFLAALLGLALSIAAAFVFEYVDDTVKTPEDLEQRVGVPVLGFVPDMESNGAERESDFHRSLATLLEPSSHVTEAYRSIRTNLFYSAPAEETKALVVTSGSPGDGKTTTATNLALVIAHSGKRVLLVDADLRRPMVQKIFGLQPGKGLSTVLIGEARLDDVIQQAAHNGVAIPNLDIVPSGPKPPNPAELLDSPAMRTLLEEARTRYDRVIIDTPPALFVADTSIVSGISDGVVLVVKSAANPSSMAIRAKEQLESVNGRILGGILNDVYIERLGHYGSGYSYYGYSRYSRDYTSYYAKRDEDEEELLDVETELAAMEDEVAAAPQAPPRHSMNRRR
jgi:capsular exopolysaccharide synthesis family protein